MAGLARNAGSANVMIENDKGQLLVVKSGYKSYWSLPGGWIDKGESPRQAAVREVREEINYTIGASEIDLVRVIHRRSATATTNQFVFKLARKVPGDTEFNLQAAEIEQYDWVSPSDVLQPADGRSYNQSVLSWTDADGAAYLEVSI